MGSNVAMISDLRSELVASVLAHSSGYSTQLNKLDQALYAALEEFQRTTRAKTLWASYTLASGANTFNPRSVLSGFESTDFERAHIDYATVHLQSIETLARYHAGGAPPAGKPSMLAFDGFNPTNALLNTTTDTGYTLKVEAVAHVEDLLSGAWTLGGDVTGLTLDLPALWREAIVRHGAKYELLAGAEAAHYDVDAARNLWIADIQRATGYFAARRPTVRDRRAAAAVSNQPTPSPRTRN